MKSPAPCWLPGSRGTFWLSALSLCVCVLCLHFALRSGISPGNVVLTSRLVMAAIFWEVGHGCLHTQNPAFLRLQAARLYI